MKLLLAAALFFLAGLPALEAHTFSMADEKFSIDVPDAWTSAPKPGVLFSAAGPQNQSAIAILVMQNNQKQAVGDPAFIDGMKKGMQETSDQQGMRIQFTDESPLMLNDVPAYMVQYKSMLADGTITFLRAYAVAANGKIYVMSLQTFDMTHDYELQNIASTLHFSSPPELPNAAQKSAVYHLGWIAMYALAFVLLALTVLCAIHLMSSTRAKPEEPPE